MIDWVSSFLAVAVVLLLYWLLRPEPSPKANLYRLPGKWYWLKKVAFRCMIYLRTRKRKNTSLTDLRGYGESSPEVLENFLPLVDNPHAMDSVCIGAYSREGLNITLRIARRPERHAEIWMCLDVPDVGFLHHPIHPDTTIYNTDPNSYSAGGLRFEMIEPMKTWRVSYSGQLRRKLHGCDDDKLDTLLDVRFSFLWNAFSAPFNYDTDLDPLLLGDAIACEQWSLEYFDRLKRDHQTYYEQWGELKGTLSIEGHPSQHLCMKAIRNHFNGVRQWTAFYRYVCCFLYIENGVTLQLSAVSHPGKFTHLRTGCITYPSGDQTAIKEVNLNLWEVGEEEQMPPAKWSFTFAVDGIKYDLHLESKMSTMLYHETDRGGVVHETYCTVTLNGKTGWGLSEFFYRNKCKSEIKEEPTLPLLSEPSFESMAASKDEWILHFTAVACSCSALVGGKGSQLALLTQLSQTEKESLHIPPGFCITLAAFNHHVKDHKVLSEIIVSLSTTAITRPSLLETVCKETRDLICQVAIGESLQNTILSGLRQVFGNDVSFKRLAVRSSAAGEDGSEASSAGQMETFLGVLGEKEVMCAVQKCWASAYTYQAVEYRRQHGQPVQTAVGVVIQEMVPAETAGVMFTADPVMQNSSVIAISANFGLGESVVSGKCDPDTYTVRKGWDSSLCILQRVPGLKTMKITMTDGVQGIIEEELETVKGSQCCLTDDVILALAMIGIKLEKYFGTARDIEWAISCQKIFLLQCRPITAVEQETEEDLIHEFDSALSTDYSWITTANIGEATPGAVTPLTLSFIEKTINKATMMILVDQGAAHQSSVEFHKFIISCCNHLFLSLLDLMKSVFMVAGATKEGMEMNLLGEFRPDLSSSTVQEYLAKPPPGQCRQIFNMLKMMMVLYKSSSLVTAWTKRLKSYTVGDKAGSASELYHEIGQHLEDYVDVCHRTILNSAKSNSWNTTLLSHLSSSEAGDSNTVISDVALLLSQCQNVFTAEVPTAIHELVLQIVQDGLKDEFLLSSNEECVQLLKNDSYPHLKNKTNNFLERHGHRCLREVELREKSWHLDPTKLISIMKTILESNINEKPIKNIQTPAQLIAKLQTPLSYFKQKILEYFLPSVWAAVRSRELGKSVHIQMHDIFKVAYWRLAGMMAQEGRLPDEDLLFFLTHYEIGTLLKSRSARLIIKAQRRRKVHLKQMLFHFQKISFGCPQTIEAKPKNTVNIGNEGSIILKGMPVSQGVVEGSARVVLSIADAHLIQAGDVLIATCTDIGWTPYFPLLAGLVTEVGGLISHGAVVAREYGIPCIVNVHDATNIIQSGVQVQMDGTLGTVKVLP